MADLDPSEVKTEEKSLPAELVKRLVIVSGVCGLVGGLVGGYLLLRYLPAVTPNKQAVNLPENSTVVDVVKKVGPSVVSITTENDVVGFFGRQSLTGAGTGIILTDDGLIMTNKHVVADSDRLSVFTADGKEYKDAKVVARDPANDIAFIRIKASGLQAIELGDSAALEVGQRVVAIGNALGRFQNTATEGIVSGLGRPIIADSQEGLERLDNLIQTDAAINPGNSGGPLVNLQGQLVGVNTAVAGGAQNIGFAIPVNEVLAAIDSVKNEGRIIRPFLGVRYLPITPEIAQNRGLKVTEGALILSESGNSGIIAGSPAEKAGLKDNDIITKVDGTKLDVKNTLSSLVGRHKVGDKVKLTVLRGDQELEIEATLEESR